MAKIKMIFTHILCFVIRIYQIFLSRLFLPSCRFHPSCSFYAIESFKHKGPIIGSFYIIKRLLRCHPWATGGYDPVEPNEEKKTWI
jgi:uncharacterized protein